MRITTVIPVYYAGHLPQVSKLRAHAEHFDMEVVAYCNSAAAATRAQELGIPFVSSGKNVGYGRAANELAEARTFDWLIVCNDDLEVSERDFDEFVRVLQSVPAAHPWTIGLIDASSHPLPPLPGMVGVFSNVSLIGAVRARIARRMSGVSWGRAHNPVDVATFSELRPGMLFPFMCVGINAACWADLGGFDTIFGLYFEDTDFLARASKTQNHRFGVFSVRLSHRRSSSTRRDLARTVPVFVYSALQYLTRYTVLDKRAAKGVLCAALIVRLLLSPAAPGKLGEHVRGIVRSIGMMLRDVQPDMPPWRNAG